MTRGLDYPAYIRDAAPPDGCCVPPGALPQVVEGHVSVAGVATVGINPHGVWHRSNYPSMKAGGAEQVWEDKRRYFENNRYRYFTALEPILNACGASYGGRYVARQPHLGLFSGCRAVADRSLMGEVGQAGSGQVGRGRPAVL